MSAAAAEKQRTACVFFPSPSTPSLDEHGDKLGREKQKQKRSCPCNPWDTRVERNCYRSNGQLHYRAVHMVRCRKSFHWAPPFPANRKPRRSLRLLQPRRLNR